ncbi:DUF6894 family protein [Rhizobium sp. PL01]|uniref:DUF6894 family protein n=1 Tax=Rhizobium sp. PL01 TaxID=3085631 RepID=UPI002981CBB7|nr:hypothetical protein [Rhizobium sp. PL01]MDW5318510.1 hypothetical protein [Rhizobium sp. PL01]
MPIYFFHVRNEEGTDEDLEGITFESVEAAKVSAAETLQEIIADELRAARKIEIGAIDITDATGTVVATVTIEDGVLQPLSLSY